MRLVQYCVNNKINSLSDLKNYIKNSKVLQNFIFKKIKGTINCKEIIVKILSSFIIIRVLISVLGGRKGR